MNQFWQYMIPILAFVIVAISANHIANYFRKVKLPVITGLLLMGMLCGPFILQLIPQHNSNKLIFINDIAMAFIAFAASAELYLKDMRGQLRSIKWMTFGQLIVTFVLSTVAIYMLGDYIPFMKDMDNGSKTAVALLMGTIFVARSPASAIAIINELRAKGPFTQVTLGVTVLKDFLVIILFAVCFNIAVALTGEVDFGIGFLGMLLAELTVSFLLGLVVGRALYYILYFHIHKYSKSIFIILLGYSVYLLSHFLKDYTFAQFGSPFHIEPLLVCIIGSFWVTNYTRFRHEFIKILEDVGPMIYVLFFTLTGATLSLDALIEVGIYAIILFLIRLITIAVGAYIGGALAGESRQIKLIGWMPYVTQAGVGLGLATIVEYAYPEWGTQFATLVIGVIIINQVIGPPLFKWAIYKVGENRNKADTPEFDGIRDAIIIGLESHSIALARQLNQHGWQTKIATQMEGVGKDKYEDIDVHKIDGLTLEALHQLEAEKSECIVLLLTDEENLALCELIYQKIGTQNVVVRLNNHYNAKKFHELGALVVDPSTAIVSLMDHFVRSPQATSLLLGMQKNQDTVDLEVLNPNLFGLALRDLRFPSDIIILSIKRRGQMIISHGYTRLRKGDWITMVGSQGSLDKMTLLFDSLDAK